MRKVWGLGGVLLIVGALWLAASASASGPSASVTAQADPGGTVTYRVTNTGSTAIVDIQGNLNTGSPPPTVTNVSSPGGSGSPGNSIGNPPNTFDVTPNTSVAPGGSIDITISTSPSGYQGTTSFTISDATSQSSVDNVPATAPKFDLEVSFLVPKQVSRTAKQLNGVLVVENVGPKSSPPAEAYLGATMDAPRKTRFFQPTPGEASCTAVAIGQYISCEVPGLPRGHETTYKFSVSLTSDEVQDFHPNAFHFHGTVGTISNYLHPCDKNREVSCTNNLSRGTVSVTG
jgi:hypothetical protein